MITYLWGFLYNIMILKSPRVKSLKLYLTLLVFNVNQ